MDFTIGLVKIYPDAKIPTKQTKDSAGYDLYSQETAYISAGKRVLIGTGIKLEIPKGYFGRILSRSSLAVKYIDVGAGVIDSDYRGEIRVLLCNNQSVFDNTVFIVNKGDRIAQLVIERCYNDVVFEERQSLDVTIRGDGGFGSTGK